MYRHVTVTTGARLHFGPLSYRPQSGRHFGGVGLMIDQPGVRLTLSQHEADRVTGEPEGVERVRHFLAKIREQQLHEVPSGCHIDVESTVPSHSGLGSGTQLGLAVARGIAELDGETDVPLSTLAARVGRGRRSAVGVYGFKSGGLIVDAGQRTGDEMGALACRLAVPDEWRVLLITPPISTDGLSGEQEEQAFAQLGSMPMSLTNDLSHLVLSELLPAVIASDFEAFSHTVYEYGLRVGQFFSHVQGGTFGSPATDTLVEQIRQCGISGVGQTSWGPTLFAFAADQLQAETMAEQLRNDVRTSGARLVMRIVAPHNRGATVNETQNSSGSGRPSSSTK